MKGGKTKRPTKAEMRTRKAKWLASLTPDKIAEYKAEHMAAVRYSKTARAKVAELVYQVAELLYALPPSVIVAFVRCLLPDPGDVKEALRTLTESDARKLLREATKEGTIKISPRKIVSRLETT